MSDSQVKSKRPRLRGERKSGALGTGSEQIAESEVLAGVRQGSSSSKVVRGQTRTGRFDSRVAPARRMLVAQQWDETAVPPTDDIVVVDLDEPLTNVSRNKFLQLVDALNWDADVYLAANPDIGVIDKQGGDLKLLAHFLRNGINERRRFSDTVAIATAFVFEQSIRHGNHVLLVGWSGEPMEAPNAILECEDGTFAILPCAQINVWREDVAKHLGLPPKQSKHGFVILLKVPGNAPEKALRLIVRDGDQLLLGAVSPRHMEIDDFMRTAFSVVQDRLTYEEMVQAFQEHYDYIRLLREPMENAFGEGPTEFRYGGEAHARPVSLSVCVVLLGKGALLKPFFSNLMMHRPPEERWEILLLANSNLDLNSVRTAAEWASAVYGIEVTVFASANNLGFGGGMNFLTSKASGQVAILSNVDLRFSHFDVKGIFEEIAGRNVILAAYQLNPSGSLQHEGLAHERRTTLVDGKVLEFFATRLIGRNTVPQALQRKQVEYFGAACLAADTGTLRKLGPFSPDYFYAYHEDCDLARRAHRKGVSCVLSPVLQVVHYESSGSGGTPMPLRAINAANLVTFMQSDSKS